MCTHHRFEPLLQLQGIACGATVVSEAGGRIDVELGGELGGRLAGTHADEEELPILP